LNRKREGKTKFCAAYYLHLSFAKANTGLYFTGKKCKEHEQQNYAEKKNS
jgi:hypothetical protein